ncbi:MAG TPA: HAD family phosphatase [Patescibacteria group bacterium]|nr:HAD family phosphatase [Patescibacteria group bacterium]
MIKAIFFDLDGLLVDTDEIIFKATNNALGEFNKKITREDFPKFFSLSGEQFVHKIVLSHRLPITELEFSSKIDNKMDFSAIRLKKGADKIINFLKNKFTLALVSNSTKQSVEKKISQLNVSKSFDLIVTLGEKTLPKPAPDIYILAAKQLHLKTSECVVFEDSENGIVASKGAGCKTIFIPNNFIENPEIISKKYKIATYYSLEEAKRYFNGCIQNET